MPPSRLVLPLFLLLVSTSTYAQVTPATLPETTKDPQAVEIVKQAFAAVGGQEAIAAIKDYTATGKMAHESRAGGRLEDEVTVSGRQWGDFRLDVRMPGGVRSQAIHGGKSVGKDPDGRIRPLYGHPPVDPSSSIMPYLYLWPVSQGPMFNLSYQGVVTLKGSSAYHIQVTQVVPNKTVPRHLLTDFRARDFFVDTVTLQVVMTEDLAAGVPHRMWYSDYHKANNILTPFTISEEIAGREMWSIHLDRIEVNPGLTNSAFELSR